MHRKKLIVIALALALIVTACGNSGPQVIKIVLALPQNIPNLYQGIPNAAQMALDESGDKVGNIPVQLVVYNTSEGKNNFSNDAEVAAAKQAVADPTVMGYIGSINGEQAKVALPISNAASLVHMSPSANWPGLTKPGFGAGEPGIYYPTGKRNFFRMVASGDYEGLAAVEWAKEQGYKTVSIIKDLSPSGIYSRTLVGVFEANAADANITIPDDLDVGAAPTQDQYNDVIAKLTASKPDAVYYTVINPDFKFLLALRAALPDTIIIGDDLSINPPNGAGIPPEAAGLTKMYAIQRTISLDQIPTAADFAKNYQAKFKAPPQTNLVTGYEATKVLLLAMQKANPLTRENVLQAMKQMGDYQGALGTWHFDDNGDISVKRLGVVQLDNGKWDFVKVINF